MARWRIWWQSYERDGWDGGAVVVACELSGGAAATVALWFRTGVAKARHSEGERARVSERDDFASLFYPCWPN